MNLHVFSRLVLPSVGNRWANLGKMWISSRYVKNKDIPNLSLRNNIFYLPYILNSGNIRFSYSKLNYVNPITIVLGTFPLFILF